MYTFYNIFVCVQIIYGKTGLEIAGGNETDFGQVFWYGTLEYCVSESAKRQSGPEFHSASIGAIPSFRFAILELATPKYVKDETNIFPHMP